MAVDPSVFTGGAITKGTATLDGPAPAGGTTVTVLSQTQPGSTPPAVTMTSPADGSTASGTVTVSATATPVAPVTISSVQFLLDGQPLGRR